MVGRWNIIIWEREYAVEKCVYAKKCANLFNVYEGCKEWGKLALKHTVSFSLNLCKETGMVNDYCYVAFIFLV